MNDFVFAVPPRVVFGWGKVAVVGEECKNLGAKRVFVITGKGNAMQSPSFGIMVDSIRKEGLECEIHAEIETDPCIETVDTVTEMVKESKAEVIVAYGGGSPMDAAKSIAMLQHNEGSIKEYMYKTKQVKNPGVPLIAVPTTAGTGSEMTAGAVTTDTVAKQKIGVTHELLFAKIAVIDPETHVTMPPSITAATGMDALTHAIEAYTSVKTEPISDALSIQAIKLIGTYLRLAVSNGRDRDARSNMALASLTAGAAFANAGLGAVHALAHPVGARFHIAHGVANAMLLPFVMEFNVIGNLEKFKEISILLGENVDGLSLRDAAFKSVDAVVKLKKDLNIPTYLDELGVKEEDLKEIIDDALSYRLLPCNPRDIHEKDFYTIMNKALGK